MKSYQNFIIQLTADKQRSEDKKPHKNALPNKLFACVTGSPAGHQNQSEATPVDFPTGLNVQLERLKSRELDLEGLIALGEELARLLLPLSFGGETRRSVRDLYHLSRAKLKPDEGLRIQIRAEAASLGNLPWEYVYVGNPNTPPSRRGYEGFLALDRKISIVRYENHGEPEEPAPREQDVLRVTVMLADLRDPNWPKLNLDQEEVNLLQALEGEDGIELTMLRPGSREQLESWVSTTEGAEVFHFSGHGDFELQMGAKPRTYEGHGSLILAGDDGCSVPLAAEKLAIELSGRGIRLAVLGACEAAERDPETPWSGVASALVYRGIPAVVGMQYTVRDDNAIAFSRRFYQALVAGKSIDSAVSEGRLGIYQRCGSSERDWGVPVLYMRTDYNVLFPKPMKAYRTNLAVLAFAAILFTAWYFLHVQVLVSYHLDKWASWIGFGVGTVPALFAAGQYIRSMASKKWHLSQRESWLDRYLNHVLAPWVSWSALLVSLILLLTTNSLYMTFDSEDGNERDVYQLINVTVDKGGEPWRKIPELTIDLEKGKTLNGGFALFQPWSNQLILRSRRPFGKTLKADFKTLQYEFWKKSFKLNAPEVFQQDDSRVIRLALDVGLYQFLSHPAENINAENINEKCQENKKYKIKISFGGIVQGYFCDPRRGAYYFGAEDEIIDDLLNEESSSDRRETLRITCAEDLPDRDFNKMMAAWNFEDDLYKHKAKPPMILDSKHDVLVEFFDENDNRLAFKEKTYNSLKDDRINHICLWKQRPTS
jgi:hypothetical protein